MVLDICFGKRVSSEISCYGKVLGRVGKLVFSCREGEYDIGL